MKAVKKIITWAITSAIIAFLLLSIFATVFRSNQPPAVKDAPFGVQTYTNDSYRIPSRYFYGEKYENINGVLTLTGHWWNYDGKKYHKHSGNKPFPIAEYGKVNLIRRR